MAKITGKEGLGFTGKARCFDSEDEFVAAVESGSIKKGEKTVVVLRYLGPKGSPGAYTCNVSWMSGTQTVIRYARDAQTNKFDHGCRSWLRCRIIDRWALQWRVRLPARAIQCFWANHIERRSHGFCIGHVVPEAQVGGPIALVKDGDIISVDAVKNTIQLHVSEEELAKRRAAWKPHPLKVSQGTLFKYTKMVSDASHGCITDA